MKASQGHPRGADSPSKGKKDATAHQKSTARNEKAKAKPIEPAVAAGPTLEVQRVQGRRTPSASRKQSVAGGSTAGRASATSGKSSESRSKPKAIALSADVRAFMKQLAQQANKNEAHKAGVPQRMASSPREDPFGKLLERRKVHRAQVVDLDTLPTTTAPGGRKHFVVLKQLLFHKRLLAAVCLAFVSLVLVGALAVLVVSGRQVPHAAAPKPLLAAVLPACNNKDCRSAMEILNLSMDANADPCKDAYALACGRWRFTDEQGQRLTYKRVIYDSYVWQAHMLLAANGSHPRPELYVPSRIYRSCINFLAEDRARLVEVWEAAGMNPEKWLAVTHLSELFSLIVDTMMVNGLENVFRIQRAAYLVVTTGRSMKTDTINPAAATDELLKEANRVLTRSGSFEGAVLLREVATLDNAVDNVTETYAMEIPETLVNSSQLDNDALGVHWTPLLRKLTAADIDAVRVNNVQAFRLLVSLIGRAPLKVAAVHALLVPVAEFMSLEYNVSLQRGRMPYGYRRRTCLSNVQRMLQKPFTWALARAVQPNGTVEAATKMWSALKHVGATMRTVAEGLQLSDMTLMHDNVEAEGDSSGPSAKPFSLDYGDAFVSNLVKHVGLTGRRLHARVALSGKPVKSRLIPALFMIPDFFYPFATETSINYGTLGVHMAKMMFNASVPQARLPKYRECFVRYARHHLGLDLSGNEFGRSLRTRWAAEVALQAWKNDRPGVSSFPPLAQLFFLRFAVAYCGNRPRRRNSLLFATRTSASYAAAFNCTNPPPVPC